MFGPREVLLTSDEAVVEQFLNGRREGPIGMSEEKDAGQVAAELAALGERGAASAPAPGTGPKGASGTGVPPQLLPSPGLPERKAAGRRQDRVLQMLQMLPEKAQEAVKRALDEEHRSRLPDYRSPDGSTAGDEPHGSHSGGSGSPGTSSEYESVAE
jgi:phospholipid/cholesterol/gamma-HCH transport system ATP-binding protein